MYQFSVDETHQIISIQISGTLDQEEIFAFLKDKKELYQQYEPNTYSLLIDVQRLDAIAQDCIPLYQEVMTTGLDWAKKIAVVHGNRMVTRMQMTRIETSLRQGSEEKIAIMRFLSMSEAYRYLRE